MTNMNPQSQGEMRQCSDASRKECMRGCVETEEGNRDVDAGI